MSAELGPLSLTGTIEERTWRTNIETPQEQADPTKYVVTVHREIVVKDGDGNVVKKVRSQGEAEMLGITDFKASRSYPAADALAIKANILADIVTCHEAVIADQKASE